MQGTGGGAEASGCLKRGRRSRRRATLCPRAARAQPGGSKQEINTGRIQPAHRMGHKSNEGDQICAVLNGQICTGSAARSLMLNQERGQARAAMAFPSAQRLCHAECQGITAVSTALGLPMGPILPYLCCCLQQEGKCKENYQIYTLLKKLSISF